LNGSYGTIAGSENEGAEMFQKLATDAGVKTDTYAAESYDAAALIMLAMQAAKSAKSADFKDKVMDVANAPGEKILPGELDKALEILASGGDIDYVGATAVEFIGNGESGGSFRQILVDGEKITTEKYR
jgi:branched-chain amino acid transport system substrate-binding protein